MDDIIRKINDYEFGWMNGDSCLRLNASWIPGAYVKYENKYGDDYLCFDIDFNKEDMVYDIKHSLYLQYPWCGYHARVECGSYKTSKAERVINREKAIEKIVVDWFVGMYGSESLLKSYYRENYLDFKEEYDRIYSKEYNKNLDTVKHAVRQFAEDFCLV